MCGPASGSSPSLLRALLSSELSASESSSLSSSDFARCFPGLQAIVTSECPDDDDEDGDSETRDLPDFDNEDDESSSSSWGTPDDDEDEDSESRDLPDFLLAASSLDDDVEVDESL